MFDFNYKTFPTGIEELDKRLGGGFPEGIMTGLFGLSNIGKTIFSLQLAYELTAKGNKVLYFDTEGLSPDQILFWANIFKERFNTTENPMIYQVKTAEKLFDALGRDFSYEIDKNSGKVGKIAVIKRNIDKRKKDQSEPNILLRENPDVVIIDSFSYLIKTTIGNTTALLPARADIEAKILAVFNEWLGEGHKFLFMTHHVSKNPTNPYDTGSIEGGDFIKYSEKVIIQINNSVKELNDLYGEGCRRFRFIRKGIMKEGDEDWFPLILKKDYGFTDIPTIVENDSKKKCKKDGEKNGDN